MCYIILVLLYKSGADPGFQVRGVALKKIAPSGGRREKFWGISCEKSRFYAQKIRFFPNAEGSAKIFGVFRVKNHDFTPKNHIFSNFRGDAHRVHPPGSAPALSWAWANLCCYSLMLLSGEAANTNLIVFWFDLPTHNLPYLMQAR